MSITLRAKRILTGALAGALVLGLLPAGVASAATTACQGAASGAFTDSNPTHQSNIDCVAAYGVVTGFADGTFGGSQNITRGQMATFIARFAATTQNIPITNIAIAAHKFTDVAGNVHADNIARVFGLGVTAGRTATTFAPNDTITRAEAATMLKNAHVALKVNLAGVTPSTAFTDLGTSVHASNINILAGAGVVSGKTATTFAPSASILRAEAATLLVRSITVLRSQNKWAAPSLVAPTTNQKFKVTASSATSITSVAYGTAATYVQYSATGFPAAVTTVSIQLARPQDVTIGANGFVTFRKVASLPRADFTNLDGVDAVGSARIRDVNGAAQNAIRVDDVPVVNGVVNFRIGTAGANTSGTTVPVVFVPTSTFLVVGATGAPTGNFAIGAQTTLNPGEGAAGPQAGLVVTAVTSTSFTGRDALGFAGTYNWGASKNDIFHINGAGGTSAANRSAFEAALSVGDTVDVVGYVKQGSPGRNTAAIDLDLVNDKPASAPAGVTAVMRDSNADGVANQLRIQWTAHASGYQTQTEIRRATVTSGVVGTFSAWTPVTATYTGATGRFETTTTGAAITQIPGTGTYHYQVRHRGLGAGTVLSAASASAPLTIAAATLASQASAPVSTVITYSESGANAGTVNAGDIITITFNEPIAVPAVDASVTVANGATNVGTIKNGDNATFTRIGSNNNQLRIVLTGSPTITAGGAPVYANLLITGASKIVDTRLTPNAWAPGNVLGAGDFPLGVNTVPGSTVVVPDEVAASGATVVSASWATITEADLTTAELIPGATITVVVTVVGAATYTATISPTGTFSITTTGIATTSVLNITQTVNGVGTSAAITVTMTS